MHILVIPYNYPSKFFPNRAVFIADQVHALRRKGHKVGVLGGIPKTLSDIWVEKNLYFSRLKSSPWVVKVPAIRGFDKLNQLLSLIVGKLLFKLYIKKVGKPDVLHLHNASAGKLALWIKEKYGIEFLVTEHSSLMWTPSLLSDAQKKLSYDVFNNSCKNIAVSLKFCCHMKEAFGNDFEYIPNVVDNAFFRPRFLVKERNERIDIISVGNLTKNKNHILLINAVSKIVKNGFNLKLSIIGEGPERRNLEDKINLLQLGGVVELLGFLSRDEILSNLQKSDFFVLPSKRETFGVVLIEALSCGLPVMALRNGGSESIINDSVGKLVSSETEFVDSLSSFLRKKFDSHKLIGYVNDHFSPVAVASALEKQYKKNE